MPSQGSSDTITWSGNDIFRYRAFKRDLRVFSAFKSSYLFIPTCIEESRLFCSLASGCVY